MNEFFLLLKYWNCTKIILELSDYGFLFFLFGEKDLWRSSEIFEREKTMFSHYLPLNKNAIQKNYIKWNLRFWKTLKKEFVLFVIQMCRKYFKPSHSWKSDSANFIEIEFGAQSKFNQSSKFNSSSRREILIRKVTQITLTIYSL